MILAWPGQRPLVKNTLSDYAAEHFEIAYYMLLIMAAYGLEEGVVAQICQQILHDEQDLARCLDQQISIVTQEFLNMQAQARRGVTAS